MKKSHSLVHTGPTDGSIHSHLCPVPRFQTIQHMTLSAHISTVQVAVLNITVFKLNTYVTGCSIITKEMQGLLLSQTWWSTVYGMQNSWTSQEDAETDKKQI